LLLKRLVALMGTAVELLLEVVIGYGFGRRFVRLPANNTAALLYRLSAFTASLHIGPGRFTTMLNPRQILVFAPRQDVR
jgi:hypothetical protein